ncbi:hypothetical protein EYF80_005737 [Liparis tanakae]|uniref:Uncharacterized protein n=1 Tax=Liparis tanakae TaxID=230148 RepID=A0A4Z2J128_9TELE|nr:hypothetical protein EYF80_005737 [Liparis tanakae]
MLPTPSPSSSSQPCPCVHTSKNCFWRQFPTRLRIRGQDLNAETPPTAPLARRRHLVFSTRSPRNSPTGNSPGLHIAIKRY